MSEHNVNYTPRLSIEITREQQEALQKINLPHGWQRAIFSLLVDEVILLNESFGTKALAVIIAKQVTPSEVIPSLSQIVEGE